jgi:hypothetical protein
MSKIDQIFDSEESNTTYTYCRTVTVDGGYTECPTEITIANSDLSFPSGKVFG